MKTSLSKGLDEELKRQMEGEFKASFLFRQQVVKNLENKIENIYDNMRDEKTLTQPNWPTLQASFIGEINAYKKLISLLSN